MVHTVGVEYFDYGAESLEADFDVEQFLEAEQENQRQRLEDELEKIEEQLEEREEIFEENTVELESKLEWYQERLEKQYKLSGPVEELKQKIEEFYRLLRREKVENWRDKQELEEERRSLLREIQDLGEFDFSGLL